MSQVERNQKITIIITPEDGYVLDTFTINGVAKSVSGSSYELTVTEDVTVSATFKVDDGNSGAGEQNNPNTYEITFNASNNSNKVSSYTSSWSVTSDEITCSINNFNNNNNEWNYVKCGRKNYASTATITTSSLLNDSIKTVTLTIDALTTSKITSIKLYVANNANFTNAATYTFTMAIGDQKVTISNPSNNCYYKIEVVCASGSSNGLLTLSKIVFSEE